MKCVCMYVCGGGGSGNGGPLLQAIMSFPSFKFLKMILYKVAVGYVTMITFKKIISKSSMLIFWLFYPPGVPVVCVWSALCIFATCSHCNITQGEIRFNEFVFDCFVMTGGEVRRCSIVSYHEIERPWVVHHLLWLHCCHHPGRRSTSLCHHLQQTSWSKFCAVFWSVKGHWNVLDWQDFNEKIVKLLWEENSFLATAYVYLSIHSCDWKWRNLLLSSKCNSYVTNLLAMSPIYCWAGVNWKIFLFIFFISKTLFFLPAH